MSEPSALIHRIRRSLIPLVVGVIIGGLLLGPAGAHISTSVRHLWRQHIRPNSDARYVNVGGDKMKNPLTVPKVTYTKPRSHILNVNMFAFEPFTSSQTVTRLDARGAAGATGTTNQIYASLSLPDGATIRSLACVFYDASTASNLRCNLRFGTRQSGSVIGLGASDSSGSGGFQRVEDTTIAASGNPEQPVVVRNSENFYWVSASPITGTWEGTSATTIKGLMVRYTLPAAP